MRSTHVSFTTCLLPRPSYQTPPVSTPTCYVVVVVVVVVAATVVAVVAIVVVAVVVVMCMSC
jgi:hypothetical protein